MKGSIFSVEEKSVLITGASRGIGHAIAKGFIESGAKVATVSRTKNINLKEVFHIEADLTEAGAARHIVELVVAKLGTISVLVNVAGVSVSTEKMAPEDAWGKTLALNLNAAFLLSNEVSVVMKKQKSGSIINVTSIGAHQGFPNNPSYVASKGGLRALTKAMAIDLASYGIRVNNLCPGYIKTEMTQKSFDDPKTHEQRTDRTILGRWGEPQDLVGPAIFLASEAASYITGTDLIVDGGWLAKGL